MPRFNQVSYSTNTLKKSKAKIFTLVKTAIVKIAIINLSVLPIKFGFIILVNSIVVPNIKERVAQNLMSRPVWFVAVKLR